MDCAESQRILDTSGDDVTVQRAEEMRAHLSFCLACQAHAEAAEKVLQLPDVRACVEHLEAEFESPQRPEDTHGDPIELMSNPFANFPEGGVL